MLRVEPGDTRNDVVIAIEDQQDVDRADVACIFNPAQRGQLKGRTAILRVARVEKVDRLSAFLLRHVFQVCIPLGYGAIDGRLVFRVQTKGLWTAAVLRAIDLSLR